MKKDNILSIIAIGCGLLLILAVFLPYVTHYDQTFSLWRAEAASRFIYIILGILVMFVYIINKKTSMSYLAAGYGVFASIEHIITNKGFEGVSIAFYLILLSSLAITIITFIYDESKSDEIISFNKNEGEESLNNIEQEQPIILETPVMPVEETIVQEQKPISFDPNTGEPIYHNQNNN